MYDTTKFAEIYISERDKEILSACAVGEILTLCPSEAQYLIELGMVYEYEITREKWNYAITPLGQLYTEFLLEREEREKLKMLVEARNVRREWVAIIASLVTSLISIAISLIK